MERVLPRALVENKTRFIFLEEGDVDHTELTGVASENGKVAVSVPSCLT